MTGENNSFDVDTAPLLADEVWTGAWLGMQGYQAVSAMLTGDQLISEARFEWSDDASSVRFVQPWVTSENPLSYGGTMSAATPTQARYVRLVVENGSSAQGATWAISTALLADATVGYVSPLVAYPRDNDPGQTVKAVLYGRREGDVEPQYIQIAVDNTGALLPGVNPLSDTNFGQRIPATLDSTLVGSFNPEQRRSLSIFNSSTAGNMYVRLGLDVDVAASDWDYKVLPGWLWVAPAWGGDIYIAWDNDADGFGHCQEVTG